MTQHWRAEVCVGAGLFHVDRVPLLRRALTRTAFPVAWDIPGGHVEKGEELRRELRREMREETEYSALVGPPFYAGTFDYPQAQGASSPTVVVDFLYSIQSSKEPRLNPAERTEFAWVQRYDSRRYPAPRHLREIIRTALAIR
jgi:ADP-ribose pyrophosphatase YjhB (NUDIX family)